MSARASRRGAPGPDLGRRLRVLLACQVGVTAGLLGLVLLSPMGAWGAWVPAAGWFFGTALYVWRFAPDATLADRGELKALALGSGLRGGLVTGALVVGAQLLWPPPEPVAVGLLPVVGALVALLAAFVLTLLTLVGLDAGRTNALGRSAS